MTHKTYWWYIGVLLPLIFLSAVAVVYVKDLHRRLVNQKQQLETQWQSLQSKKSQLLLERSALTSPVRIQNIAQSKLNMRQPKPSEIKLLYAEKQRTSTQ